MGLYLLSRGPHCESPWTNGQITSGQWRRGSKGTRSYRRRPLQGNDFIPVPRSLLTPFRAPLSPVFPLLFYDRRPPRPRRRCHPPEKRIRRYTSASKFPSDCPYPSSSSSSSPLPPSSTRPFTPTGPSRFLSFPEILRWKNMAFCLRFCTPASETCGGDEHR